MLVNQMDKLMKQLLAVAVAALSIHTSSHADVMYTWSSAANGTPVDVSMTLVFSDDAVAQGALSYHVNPMQTTSSVSGLKYFWFGADNLYRTTYDPTKSLFAGGTGYLDLNLQFNPAGYLTGRIYANDQNSDVTLASNTAGLFTISAMHSDQDPMGTRISCDGKPGCTWSSGALERVTMMQAAASQVPEPGSLALIGLGMLGLGWAVKRRS
jgi:hypothetical protein